MVQTTLETVTCPLCEDGHELTIVQNGRGVTYRCNRHDREFLPMPSPSASMPSRSPAGGEPAVMESTQIFDGDTTSAGGPPPSITVRDQTASGAGTTGTTGSVVHRLRSRYGAGFVSASEGSSAIAVRAKYEVAEHIAQGGMGRVTLVKDVDLNRKVAMKTLLPDLANSPEYVSKFVEEAQIIGQLEHPNITPLYELGMAEDDSLFFTMKYVDGETLDAVIKRLQAGDPETHAAYSFHHRVEIVKQISDALAFAHCKGVLHRDLKPSNIMIGRYGEVQVMDWGISKRIERRPDCTPEPGTPCADAEISQVKLESPAPHETAAGSAVGTAFYMSPEQIGGGPEALAPRSDVYSLGVMLYEFLSLHRPHKGKTVSEVLRRVLSEEPPPLSAHNDPIQGHVPIQLQAIVSRAMAKDPDQRYQSVPEFKRDLQGYLDGHINVCCTATAMKSGLGKADHLIDNHARAVIVGLTLAAASLIGAITWLAIT